MKHRSSPRRLLRTAFCGLALVGAGLAGAALDGPEETTPSGFAFEKEVLVPGAPEAVFDAFTGDVSGWWDHTFSDAPKALYIEPRPGGGFYEIVDDAGHGALHATVTRAERGKVLQFTGPLGLAQTKAPVFMVHTFEFTSEGDATRIALRVAAVGELGEGIGAVVQRVWDHFLDERFVPFVKGELR